jgi:hypothetical protein
MLIITQIKPSGEISNNGGGSFFHRQSIYTLRNICAGKLPSHLILLDMVFNLQ